MPLRLSSVFTWHQPPWRNAGKLVFGGTVLISYAASVWEGKLTFSHPRDLACLAAGLIYLGLGSIDLLVLCEEFGQAARIAYLLVQGILLAAILWTSRLSGELPVCIYPLVGMTVALLGRRGMAPGVFAVYALMLALEGHFYGRAAAEHWAVGTVPAYAFVVAFTLLALRANQARRRAEDLTAEVEQLAVVRERNRLAGEIHDSLGHYLTTIHVQLQGARAVHDSDPARALEAVARAQGLAREALDEVRRSVATLKADTSPGPLPARLRELAGADGGWGAAVSVHVLGRPRPLPAAAEHALFRSAQEGLTNVRKHAAANKAELILDYRDCSRTTVQVRDDGRGVRGNGTGHGLSGLRERIEALGGSVRGETAPEGGFRLEVEIPA